MKVTLAVIIERKLQEVLSRFSNDNMEMDEVEYLEAESEALHMCVASVDARLQDLRGGE